MYQILCMDFWKLRHLDESLYRFRCFQTFLLLSIVIKNIYILVYRTKCLKLLIILQTFVPMNEISKVQFWECLSLLTRVTFISQLTIELILLKCVNYIVLSCSFRRKMITLDKFPNVLQKCNMLQVLTRYENRILTNFNCVCFNFV